MARTRQLALLILGAVAAGLMLAVATVGSSTATFGEVLAYLLAGSLFSLGLTVAALRWLRRGSGPIWLQMTITYAVGVAISLVNVLLNVQAMLISPTYLPKLVLLLLFAGVISLILGVGLAGVIAARVSLLNAGARTLAEGNLTARVPVAGSDEIAELGREFNQMAAQLAASAGERARQEAARRELVVAVSHDLRTPLASLRAMTEALADGVVDDPATTQRYLGTMRNQIGLLSSLINDLFELSQLDAGALEIERVRVAPSELIDEAVNGLRPQADARGVTIVAEPLSALPPVQAAPQKIGRVLNNLIDNALRHTPAGGCVTLRAVLKDEGGGVRDEPSVERDDHHAGFIQHPASSILFEVCDTGAGIAPEDLPYVFDRFYRGEKSRSRATGGAGLGLAIARGIVEAHGGQIWIESARGAGTAVRFTLPTSP